MPRPDAKGDCEMVTPVVSHSADDLLGRMRGVLAGEGIETVLATARTLTFTAAAAYWDSLLASRGRAGALPFRYLPSDIMLVGVPGWAGEMATAVGAGCSELDCAEAGYRMGSLYTGLMPDAVRATLGAYYTRPALCERLLDMVTAAGVDWATARVLDPACGGGAFLSPVAKRMMDNLAGCDPENRLSSVESRLRGLELDPFASWLSQVLLDASLVDTCLGAGRLPGWVVTVCDALEAEPEGRGFDLVVGKSSIWSCEAETGSEGKVCPQPVRAREFVRRVHRLGVAFREVEWSGGIRDADQLLGGCLLQGAARHAGSGNLVGRHRLDDGSPWGV